jgi:hypothetical protein
LIIDESFAQAAVTRGLRDRKVEELPLLKTVAREWLVKTADWKRLSGCCCDS